MPAPRSLVVGGRRLTYPTPASAAATSIMRGNRSTDTRAEVRLRSSLHRKGFRFRKNLRISACGTAVRPDLVFPRQKVAVFVDGCFWHGCSIHGRIPRTNTDYWNAKIGRNVERDAQQAAALEEDGWCVIRVWEHVPIEEAAPLVMAAIAAAQALASE